MTITEFRRRERVTSKTTFEPIILAVWGPHGSPGKSTVALNLAFELASHKRTLLVDLDLESPNLTLLLGVTEPSVGITGVARLIRQGRLNLEQLLRLSVNIKQRNLRLSLLPGLANPNRWPEITEETVSGLLAIAKYEFDVIIFDLSSSLEENLYQTSNSSTRNGATRKALQLATQTITVLKDSKVSLQNYVNQFLELQTLNSSRLVVVNQHGVSKLERALRELTKETVFHKIPNDLPSLELSEAQGLPLALSRRKSPARNAILSLANRLLECSH